MSPYSHTVRLVRFFASSAVWNARMMLAAGIGCALWSSLSNANADPLDWMRGEQNGEGAYPTVPFPVPAAPRDAPREAAKPPLSKAQCEALSDEVEAHVVRYGYDEAIKAASPALNGVVEADRRLSYWRGYAAWQIGYFGMAGHDFRQAGDYAPYRAWSAASDYLQKIEELKALAPVNVIEVKEGPRTLFRVYFDEKSVWTRAIIEMLPRAYETSRAMIGREMYETPVMIFKDHARFEKFYQIRSGITAPAWAWAAGGMGGLYFCQGCPEASPLVQDSESAYFKGTIVHEFNHCLVGRFAGTQQLPNWFKEGIALVAEGRNDEARCDDFKIRMQRVLRSRSLLPLAALSNWTSFAEKATAGINDRKLGLPAADPYAQSYYMASYFLSLLPEDGLNSFLTDVRAKGNFEAAFRQHTHLTSAAFYTQWHDWITEP